MRGYYIKVGEKEIGPFRSEQAAKREAKELREAGFEAKPVSRTVSEQTWIDALGAGEQEIDLDDTDTDDDDEDIDWDAIFNEDDDDDSDDDDDDDDDDSDDDLDDDDDDDDDDEDKDKAPSGVHPFFAPFGGS